MANGADFDPATPHDWHVLEAEWQSKAERLDQVAEDRASYGSKSE